MKKAKYFFDHKTLSYKKAGRNIGLIILRSVGFLSLSIMMGFILALIFFRFLDSPKESLLREENKKYKVELVQMANQLNEIKQTFALLAERDKEVYRSIYEAEPISEEERLAGTGGSEQYAYLKNLSDAELIINVRKKMDQIQRQFDVQKKSYNELTKLANSRQKFLASIPAIQPVSNKELTRIASGFGYRIDPFYRTPRLHAGMDFTAPTGSAVYATADGVVESVERTAWGYGLHIIINHGFGYTTLYGHLSKTNISKGAKVLRGQLIGAVGSTGKSTAPHLHYEVRKNDEPQNPAYYFFNDLTDADYELMLKRASAPNQSFD